MNLTVLAHPSSTWSSPKWPRCTRACDIVRFNSIWLTRLKFSTTKNVRRKCFRLISGLFVGFEVKNVALRYCHKCNILRNDQNCAEFCFWTLYSFDHFWWDRDCDDILVPHFLGFFPGTCQIAALSYISWYCCLLHTTYHLCIVVILKIPARAATTRLSSYTFCKTLIGMHARSQNLILPIITFRSLPSDCHHRTANKLIVIWRWWLEDLHCDRRELKRCLSGNKVKGLVAIASGILKIQIFVFAWMTLLLTFQFSFTLLALDNNYLIM